MKSYDCVILGAGPAGMTAALYLYRAGYSVLLVAGGEIGGNLNKINYIENYPGISCTGKELADKIFDQIKNYIEVDYFNKAVSIVKNVIKLSDNTEIFGKTIFIAIGSTPNILNQDFEKVWLNKIHFCATCDGPLYKDKTVAVIGGGNSAMDFCLALGKYCKQIYLIHRRDTFRASQDMIDKVKNLLNVKFIMNSNVTNYLGNNKIEKIIYKTNNYYSELLIDGVFYALGSTNNKIPIDYDSKNYFYIGDCAKNDYKQVITACSDGCQAAMLAIKCLEEGVFN